MFIFVRAESAQGAGVSAAGLAPYADLLQGSTAGAAAAAAGGGGGSGMGDGMDGSNISDLLAGALCFFTSLHLFPFPLLTRLFFAVVFDCSSVPLPLLLILRVSCCVFLRPHLQIWIASPSRVSTERVAAAVELVSLSHSG